MSTRMHTRLPVAWDGPHIGKKRLRLVVRDWGSALPTLSFFVCGTPVSLRSLNLTLAFHPIMNIYLQRQEFRTYLT